MLLERKKSYNFNTLAPSILGVSYKSMTVESIIGFDDAVLISNVLDTHNNIKEVVVGLPESVQDLTFYKLKDVNGKIYVFAHEWLDESSIVLVTTIGITILLSEMSSDDILSLRNILIQNGYGGNIQDIKIT